MLTILWFAVLCFGVGAQEYPDMQIKEIKALLDKLYTSSPDEEVYNHYPEESSTTEGYPEATASEHEWPSTEPPSPEYSSTSHVEWPSTEPTPVDCTESPPDEHSEGYVPSEHHSDTDESGNKYPVQVGSIRGIPGVNFPDYTDIPLTSFSCSDKAHIPGFYADMETGCQVFHVCWPHRRESFLCPLGTIFNQAILACDYWYSSNCSLASYYYDVNSHSGEEYSNSHVGLMIDILEKGYAEPTAEHSEAHSDNAEYPSDTDLSYILKFLPVKAKVTVYPETADSPFKIVAKASVGKKQKVHSVNIPQSPVIHEQPKPVYTPVEPKPVQIPHYVTSPKKVVVPKKEVGSTHGATSPDIAEILDQVIQIAKKILIEAEKLHPMYGVKPVHRVEKSVPVRKHLPLTELNPRFITRPVPVPKKVIYKPVVVRPVEVPEVSKAYLHRGPPPKISHPVHKPHSSHPVRKIKTIHKAHVSPLTKKALTENYLKLLKIKLG